MELGSIEVNVAMYDVNSVLPVSVVAPISQHSQEMRAEAERIAKEKREKAEAERIAQVVQRIKDSGIIATINKRLLDGCSFYLLRGNIKASDVKQAPDEWIIRRDFSPISGVTSTELMNYLKQQYENAGYHIYHYTFSTSYWKDEELWIYAPSLN